MTARSTPPRSAPSHAFLRASARPVTPSSPEELREKTDRLRAELGALGTLWTLWTLAARRRGGIAAALLDS
jgi:hypothetical protein